MSLNLSDINSILLYILFIYLYTTALIGSL